jgi:hypothetical protein
MRKWQKKVAVPAGELNLENNKLLLPSKKVTFKESSMKQGLLLKRLKIAHFMMHLSTQLELLLQTKEQLKVVVV